MGFWSVLAIVLGSQIGSGVLVTPASLAPYGYSSFIGLCIAAFGAIALALVFADLCNLYPKTGGPHVYVEHAFNRKLSFFTGWTYWLVSWISSTVVVISGVTYLTPFIGNSQETKLLWEIGLLIIISSINCKSVKLSGQIEFVLTILKFLPLTIIPLAAILSSYFSLNNICTNQEYSDISVINLVGSVSAISFWGFVGVECATAPAGYVENAKTTIPKALIIGTICVACVYLFNMLCVMGSMHSTVLSQSQAPYAELANMLWGSKSASIVAILASIICIGTLNAWTLTSGQIALGLSNDNLLPKLFSKCNKNGAPYVNIIISCAGMAILLILTKNDNLSTQLKRIIDFSVTSFFFIYIVCCIAHIKISFLKLKRGRILISTIAIFFCMFVIYNTEIISTLTAILFTISGIFMYPFANKKSN